MIGYLYWLLCWRRIALFIFIFIFYWCAGNHHHHHRWHPRRRCKSFCQRLPLRDASRRTPPRCPYSIWLWTTFPVPCHWHPTAWQLDLSRAHIWFADWGTLQADRSVWMPGSEDRHGIYRCKPQESPWHRCAAPLAADLACSIACNEVYGISNHK